MKKANDVGVFQLPDGFWGYRFKVMVNGKSVEKKRLTDDNGMKFKSKTAAAKARKLAIHLAESAPQEPTEPAPPERKTVSDIYNEYCEKGRTEKAYGTVRKQDSLWKIHLKTAFGSRYVDEISTAEVKDYLAHLYYEDDLAYRYVESFLKMFYLIFGQAYSRGYLPVDTYNKLCVNKSTKITMPKLTFKSVVACCIICIIVLLERKVKGRPQERKGRTIGKLRELASYLLLISLPLFGSCFMQ